MFSKPASPEIDHRTIKLVIGVVALSLPVLTNFFASADLTSISASYYEGGWSQAIFIGFLFAIAALLLAYNGHSWWDMFLSKVASIAGLGIALFPCKCAGHVPPVPIVHVIAATVMFLVLAYFCWRFLQRAKAKAHARAMARVAIYAACGIAILASIAVLGYDAFSNGALSARIPRLTFIFEATALVAFGISWLLASRVLPVITGSEERFSPFREQNPV